MSMRDRVKDLEERRARIKQMGGEEKVRKQHERGKWTARERMDRFFDDAQWFEIGIHGTQMGQGDKDKPPADAVVCGYGRVDGRLVCAAAYDFTVKGGSIGPTGEVKVTRLRELALRNRVPMVWFIDSAGARIDPQAAQSTDAISLFAGYGALFREEVIMSGVVPLVSAVVGPGAAGTAYIPGLADFVPMIKDVGSMALGGPPLVKAVTGQDISEQELGGSKVHTEKSGVGDVEVVEGDLRDLASLRAACRGVDRIYHCAAQISTVDGQEQSLFESNVLGTKNLLQAARERGVGRVVVTGSFSAVGHRHDGVPADETVPFNPFDRVMPYEKSKQAVELECLRAVVDGQDVVVATSCAIIGPHDYLPSRMGAVLRDFANGRLRAYIPGGFEFVAARDIVAGHLLAMEKGRTGHKYIFSSGFHSMDDMMAIYERVTGRKRPLRLPAPLLAAIAPLTQFVQSTLFPSRPQRLTPGAIRVLRLMRHADTQKAQRELGFEPTPLEDAVREAYAFFVARGAIRNPRGKIQLSVAARPDERKRAVG